MTKSEFSLYAVYDHTGIARHLEEQAEKGWMLEKIGPWTYRDCPPQKLHFAVAYIKDEYDNQDRYADLCAQVGWEEVDRRGMMMVFCSRERHPVPLETEPTVQVQNIHRCMRSQIINDVCWLLFLLRWNVPEILTFLEAPAISGFFSFLVNVILIVSRVLDLFLYFSWYLRAKRVAREENRFLPTYSLKGWRAFMFAFFILFLAVSLLGGTGRYSYLFALSVALVFITLFIPLMGKLTESMRKKGTGESIWKKFQFSSQVIPLLVVALAFGYVAYNNYQWQKELGLIDIYKKMSGNDKTMPLTISELTDWSDSDYSTSISKNTLNSRTYTLYKQKAKLTARMEEGQPDSLIYTISTGTGPVIGNYVAETAPSLGASLTGKTTQASTAYDVSQWRAEEGYHAVSTDGHHHYLLAWSVSAIEIEFSWQPTEEQLNKAIQELLNRNQ